MHVAVDHEQQALSKARSRSSTYTADVHLRAAHRRGPAALILWQLCQAGLLRRPAMQLSGGLQASEYLHDRGCKRMHAGVGPSAAPSWAQCGDHNHLCKLASKCSAARRCTEGALPACSPLPAWREPGRTHPASGTLHGGPDHSLATIALLLDQNDCLEHTISKPFTHHGGQLQYRLIK